MTVKAEPVPLMDIASRGTVVELIAVVGPAWRTPALV
jgi:hypothetical protein